MSKVSRHTTEFMCELAKQLRPKEALTISEWADKYMILPAGSNEAGKFKSDSIPYQKEIMDAITDPEVTDVAVMSSAQVGKTTIIMCGIGYYIDYEPTTQMLVMPTLNDGERFSKTRFAQMIEDVSQLHEKVADAKAKNSNNTLMLKKYPGGSIAIAGANSPASLASDPRRIIWMDEVDRFPDSAGGEGNPIKLAEKRATSYWNKKHIKTSTPTIKGRSNIETAFNKGTMERWSVACPSCGEYQEYDFKRLKFDFMEMACKYCGVLHTEQAWKESSHKWIAEHPERKKYRSFTLNELASPFVDWEDIVENFKDASERLKTYHDTEDLKVFINTVLGQTWDETDAVDKAATSEDEMMKRAEKYGADLPEGVLVLTASVDVQDDRFEIEVKGWARNYESWGIYKTEIYGDLIQDDIWQDLESYLSQTYSFENGSELNIAGFCIDSGGHYTNKVYKWTKEMKQKGYKCWAVKGYAGKPDIQLLHKKTVVEIKEERPNGKSVVVDRTAIQILGVDSGKDDITNRLTIEKPGAGYCHFPQDRGYDEDYYKGLTSERKITKKVNGVFKTVWVKKAGVRNEPLDLFNYNLAALELIRPDFDVLEKKLEKGINYMKPSLKRAVNKRKSYNAIDI